MKHPYQDTAEILRLLRTEKRRYWTAFKSVMSDEQKRYLAALKSEENELLRLAKLDLEEGFRTDRFKR
jgi:hypothetical protein